MAKLTSRERRVRLGGLAEEAERRGWRDLARWCLRQIARLILAERAAQRGGRRASPRDATHA